MDRILEGTFLKRVGLREWGAAIRGRLLWRRAACKARFRHPWFRGGLDGDSSRGGASRLLNRDPNRQAWLPGRSGRRNGVVRARRSGGRFRILTDGGRRRRHEYTIRHSSRLR